MKQVINGKLFNTQTANLIMEWSNGLYTNDFNFLSEDLYKTNSGLFFIHRQTCFDNSLELVTTQEAKAWLEDFGHGNVEAYTKAFGQPEEA